MVGGIQLVSQHQVYFSQIIMSTTICTRIRTSNVRRADTRGTPPPITNVGNALLSVSNATAGVMPIHFLILWLTTQELTIGTL